MERALEAHWMPFTDNRSYKKAPRMLVAAEGVHFRDRSGRRILDATSGLWCVNAGHGRPNIVAAIQRQAATLGYAPSFQFGHPAAFKFASRLAAYMPSGLDRILFTNSGSEGVDTALKIALAYHHARGEGRRTKLVGRERSYHGAGFGGISVGGLERNRAAFGPLLPGTDHIRHTYDPAQSFTRGQPLAGACLADDLERLVTLHGAETIAAVIVEPMAGSTGVLVPPDGYLERLRELTLRHGILLIFDEVITGFGRIGSMTAAQRFDIKPDMIVLAKGLTNGAVPMGAVAARREIYDVITDLAAPGIELFHGYTCSGHPLAAAAGLATLDLFESENLCAQGASMSEVFEDAVHSLRELPLVKDIRNLGLAAGIDLEPITAAPGRRGMEVLAKSFETGLLVRVTGDTVALAPPLIISEAQIGEMVERLSSVLWSLN